MKKCPLHLFVENLPMTLQAALILACGPCRYIRFINASVTYILISLTDLGVVCYAAIMIAGTLSYACPFQTPVFITFSSPRKRFWHGIVSYIVHPKQMLSWIHRMRSQRVWPLLRCQSLPTILLGNVRVQQPEPRLNPKDLGIVRQTNTNCVWYMSQILRTTTDLEALDAAIQCAGMIWRFDNEISVDSARRFYPGLRDRANYSGRAMILFRRMLFSSRLRQIIIHFVEFVGYQGLKEVVSPYRYREYRW